MAGVEVTSPTCIIEGIWCECDTIETMISLVEYHYSCYASSIGYKEMYNYKWCILHYWYSMVYAAGTVKHNLFTIMPWVRTLVLTYIIVISHIGWFFTSSFLSNSCISLNRCDFSFLDIPFGRNGFYSLVAQVFFYHIFWHMCSWWLCSFYQLSVYNDYHKS